MNKHVYHFSKTYGLGNLSVSATDTNSIGYPSLLSYTTTRLSLDHYVEQCSDGYWNATLKVVVSNELGEIDYNYDFMYSDAYLDDVPMSIATNIHKYIISKQIDGIVYSIGSKSEITAAEENILHSFITEYCMHDEKIDKKDESLFMFAQRLPGVQQLVELPIRGRGESINLSSAIIELNDKYRWPREKIADWLDELADEGKINIDFEDELYSTD